MNNQPTDPEYVLRGVAGAVFGRSYHLLAPTNVGRAPECDICLDSSGISRLHARLRPLEYGVEIEDLKSTNGSFLNGQRIAVGVARVGDEIAFDELRFRLGAVPRKAQQASANVLRKKNELAQRGWLWAGLAAVIAAGAIAVFTMQ